MSCKANKARLARHTALRKPMVSERPWYHVHIDLWQPGIVSSAGHKYVLTVVDRLTHWPEMIPLINKEASTVAEAFFEHVICRHGVPAVVVSDNGTEFDGVFDILTKKYGIKRIRTSPWHPQANGIVERLHGFMRGSIAAMSSADQTQWHHLLPVTAFAYRSTPLARLRLTPFFLMHGREPVLPGELRADNGSKSPTPVNEFVSDLKRRLSTAYCRAREMEIDDKLQRLAKATYVPDTPFDVGDKVLLRRIVVDSTDSHKLTPRWVPQVVIAAKHPHYHVQDVTGRVTKTIVRYLRVDHSTPRVYGDHVPDQPSADSTATDSLDLDVEVESLVIVASDRPDEPWCLARVHRQSPDPAFCDIHYYNRSNKDASPDRWSWRPAYVRPSDGLDILTYTPGRYGRHLQPYHRTVPLSKILVSDIRLTRTGAICSADLQRISASSTTTWCFRKRKVDDPTPTPGVGTRISRKFGKHGAFVGEVISKRTDSDGEVLWRVRYTDGDGEEFNWEELREHSEQFQASGFRHTAPAAQPSSSLLSAKRLRRAAARRPAATSEEERANAARITSRAARDTRAQRRSP